MAATHTVPRDRAMTECETEYFECQCGSEEHSVKFHLSLDDEPADTCLYLCTYMDNRRGFWRRLWLGLRYAFGHQSEYGAFGSWLLQPSDAARLGDMCGRFITHYNERVAAVLTRSSGHSPEVQP